MDAYYLIFTNSLHSALILSFNSETAWFAARAFGGIDMTYATLAAFAGAMVAMCINYGMGYYLQRVNPKKMQFGEEAYKRGASLFNRYLVWILFFPQVPFLGLLVTFAGLFAVSPRKTLTVIAVGRICYYGFYLFHTV